MGQSRCVCVSCQVGNALHRKLTSPVLILQNFRNFFPFWCPTEGAVGISCRDETKSKISIISLSEAVVVAVLGVTWAGPCPQEPRDSLGMSLSSRELARQDLPSLH